MVATGGTEATKPGSGKRARTTSDTAGRLDWRKKSHRMKNKRRHKIEIARFMDKLTWGRRGYRDVSREADKSVTS